MPALTHIRKPTATHEMMKNAIPTPQIGALLSVMLATCDMDLKTKGSRIKRVIVRMLAQQTGIGKVSDRQA